MIQQIEQELRDLLPHLYDANFSHPAVLGKLFGSAAAGQETILQSQLIRIIESLKPLPDVPLGSRMARFYEVLYNRFVLRLTLEETALRMNISVSSTWREQRAAIYMLAAEIWKRTSQAAGLGGAAPQASAEPADQADQSDSWLAQTRRELASLQSYSPDPVSDIGPLIDRVLEIEQPLAAKHGVKLEVGAIKRDLVAAVHPSVLRQVLIIAIGNFLRRMNGGRLALFARLEDGNVKVTITGSLEPGAGFSADEMVRDLPLPDETSAEIHQDGKQVFLWLKLPYINRVNVLVVDDNLDLVRFYQRATEGTSYRIIHSEGRRDIVETLLKVRPDIIVLDVMLPEVDGWELLMQIHASPAMQAIPVIVCSVVKEEELALSLGAVRFISKPVRPEAFVAALDQVLAQVP